MNIQEKPIKVNHDFGRYTRVRTDITIQEHIQEPIEEIKIKIIEILKQLGIMKRIMEKVSRRVLISEQSRIFKI